MVGVAVVLADWLSVETKQSLVYIWYKLRLCSIIGISRYHNIFDEQYCNDCIL